MQAEPRSTRSTSRRSPTAEERQRDAERSRARLLDAALEEFSRRGFAGTRVQDIAARAGVNAQLISYYFGGKAGLYRALHESWLETETGFADPELSLEELMTAYLRAVLEDPRRARLLLWAGLADDPSDSDTAPQARTGPRDIADLERRQSAGELAPDLDPAIFQIAIMGLILAPLSLPQVVRELTGSEPTDPEFARRFTAELTKILRHLAP
jgi:TetR/AcrR family transcriptional regulator